MTRIIYADNAATTPVSETALEAMMPYFREQFGNPSGFYAAARRAKTSLEEARAQVAAVLGAQPDEIYFAGGGSESDNWALKGAAENYAKKGKHIITTKIEHHALLRSAEFLQRHGFEVTYLNVDETGLVSLDELKAAIRPDTVLISVMTANNEIGTIQSVAEIGAVAREHGILFHTDAVQAVGHIPINVNAMNIDMLSLSSHKFNGPKGVGALYIRKGVRLPSFIDGGGQEKGKRGGTENVAGIVGMAAALTEADAHLAENAARVSAMRDRLLAGIAEIPYSRITGARDNRLPGIASCVFECIEGESMVLMLDMEGICASSGSACSSGSLDPSHVLLAIGLPHEVAHGSLRLSLSADNTDEDINYILAKLPPIIERLRFMSPVWEEKMKGENQNDLFR